MKPLNVRQKKIISLLNDYETLTVSELSSLTESSEATIRRDLIILSEQNHNLPCGSLTKELHIRWNTYEEFVLLADSPILINCYN